jgi:hypothetical protein
MTEDIEAVRATRDEAIQLAQDAMARLEKFADLTSALATLRAAWLSAASKRPDMAPVLAMCAEQVAEALRAAGVETV